MPETSASTPTPVFDIKSPSISIAESGRESIINIIFNMPPEVSDWLLNTFDDSHLEMTGEGENKHLASVPNSVYYECSKCKTVKNREVSPSRSYLMCNGTAQKKHDTQHTKPIGWKPILKDAGLYYLVGQAKGSLNTNIATANFSVSTVDLKQNMTLEDRLRYNAWYLSYTMLAVVVGQYNRYVSDWVIQEKRLHTVFNTGFCTNFMIQMTNNITANYTKGKGMAAARSAMEHKVSTESTQHSTVDYQQAGQFYTGGSGGKSLRDQITGMFNFNK